MTTKHQRGNQNPYIKEEQTTKWPNENVQKDKQRSTKRIIWLSNLLTFSISDTRAKLDIYVFIYFIFCGHTERSKDRFVISVIFFLSIQL
jgi:hypothetical protein